MKLIRIGKDGETHVSGEEDMVTTPVPKEVLDALHASFNSPESEEEMFAINRRMIRDAAILGPMPVGGEDAYIESMKRE